MLIANLFQVVLAREQATGKEYASKTLQICFLLLHDADDPQVTVLDSAYNLNAFVLNNNAL